MVVVVVVVVCLVCVSLQLTGDMLALNKGLTIRIAIYTQTTNEELYQGHSKVNRSLNELNKSKKDIAYTNT